MKMTEQLPSLTHFYQGWGIYQQHLLKAISPLSLEQLELRAAPHLRSIGETTTHIIAVRARWFHTLMGEGSADMDVIEGWDQQDASTRSTIELLDGLEATWQMIQEALARWVPADLAYVFHRTYQGHAFALSRQWAIWHTLEHDIHHGGEISLTLGLHGLATPDL